MRYVFPKGHLERASDPVRQEAARIAVANKLNVKLFFDDNDVTIAGHPSKYLPGYDLKKTLEGHGVPTIECEGENLDSLFGAMAKAIGTTGPAAVVMKRKMAPGVKGIEGTSHGHDVIPVDKAIAYLKERGYDKAEAVLKAIHPAPVPYLHVGSTKDVAANRVQFGEAVSNVLDANADRKKDVMVIDSDLEGSTGLKVIHTRHPEVFVPSGIMERSNLSAAAGFGFDANKFGGAYNRTRLLADCSDGDAQCSAPLALSSRCALNLRTLLMLLFDPSAQVYQRTFMR